jgi:low affinity Fe/Cu permease
MPDSAPAVADDAHSTRIARTISNVTSGLGSFPAILVSLGLVLAWLAGSLFVKQHLANDTYQLLINSVTSIVTFLMVFIIQNTQNRDGQALQTKLDAQNEVLVAIARHLDLDDDADLLVKLVGVEDAPERAIRDHHAEVRNAARNEG